MFGSQSRSFSGSRLARPLWLNIEYLLHIFTKRLLRYFSAQISPSPENHLIPSGLHSHPIFLPPAHRTEVLLLAPVTPRPLSQVHVLMLVRANGPQSHKNYGSNLDNSGQRWWPRLRSDAGSLGWGKIMQNNLHSIRCTFNTRTSKICCMGLRGA
jgi:hypothetical protein